MKSLKLVLFISALFCFITATNGLGVNWVLYGERGGMNYYDLESMATTPEGTELVWVKRVYSSSGKRQYISLREKWGRSTEGYEDLVHTNSLFELSCHGGGIALISSTDYNRSGKTLDSATGGAGDQKWKPITPGSADEDLFKRVCGTK
jgi:hypothetical protein